MGCGSGWWSWKSWWGYGFVEFRVFMAVRVTGTLVFCAVDGGLREVFLGMGEGGV